MPEPTFETATEGEAQMAELVAVIAAVALLLVAVGPGRLSIDHALAGRRTAAVHRA